MHDLECKVRLSIPLHPSITVQYRKLNPVFPQRSAITFPLFVHFRIHLSSVTITLVLLFVPFTSEFWYNANMLIIHQKDFFFDFQIHHWLFSTLNFIIFGKCRMVLLFMWFNLSCNTDPNCFKVFVYLQNTFISKQIKRLVYDFVLSSRYR